MTKQKFIIQPHFRLQEWVADEKGYFRDEGLDYVFEETVKSTEGKSHDQNGAKSGAYQTFEQGRTSDVNCACHWTVNVAASKGHGKLWADVYSVAPAGIFVPHDLPVKRPEDLAGIPISVGYQSGSHYSSIQALEQYLPADKINLSFAEGMLFKRLDNLLEGKSQASTLFSGPYYLAEQLGYRKIVDTTFMIASMITGSPGRRRPQEVLPCSQARATGHRSAPGPLHALLHERVSNALPRHNGYTPLGTGRTHRIRAVHRRGVRTVARLDRGTRDFRRRQAQHGIGQLQRRGRPADLMNL